MDTNSTRAPMSRRSFVKTALLGTGIAAGASVLGGCAPQAPSKLPKKWDVTTDVVIVGFGGAGAAAAIEATKAGAKVAILERMPMGGGSTALCGGIVYCGGGTALQNAVGVQDTADGMYKYLFAAAGDGADGEFIKLFVDSSIDLYNWMVGLGIKFKPTKIEGKYAAIPTEDGLAYSGNETAAPYRDITPPVMRGHHVQGEGESGKVMWPPLEAAVDASGAEVFYETLAQSLVVNDEGRVVGLKAMADGEEMYFKANKAVILSAGGFAANSDMITRHCPEFLRSGALTGTDGDDGSGIRMGQGAGGDVRHLSAFFSYASPYMYYEPLIQGILVNSKGSRFIAEDNYGHYIGAEIVRRFPNSFLIVDSAIWSTLPQALLEHLPKAGEAATVAELGKVIDVNGEFLAATVDRYNQFAEQGQDPEFSKEAKYIVSLKQGPFYALAFPAQYCPKFSMGGLRINTRTQVLNAEGQPIPGLFSAGRNATAVSAQNYPGSGVSVGEAFIFGRIAGKEAAALESWA